MKLWNTSISLIYFERGRPNGCVKCTFYKATTLCVSHCLKCWKCLGKECEGDPSNCVNAHEMTCGEGAACMKVFYRLDDKVFSYVSQSVVRTCSAGPCVEITEAQYSNCTEHRDYGWYGCVIRKCCDDYDMCNNNPRLSANISTLCSQICFTMGYVYLFFYSCALTKLWN